MGQENTFFIYYHKKDKKMITTKGYFCDIMLSWFKPKADRPLTFPPIFIVLQESPYRVVGTFLLKILTKIIDIRCTVCYNK